MSSDNDYPELPAREKERGKRREKKQRPQWKISGRGVFTLAQIVRKKARGKRE